MKRLLLISFLLIISSFLKAQDITTFKKDFKIALDHKITNKIADSLINKHYGSLLWFYDISQEAKAYPLKEIIDEGIYQNNIDKLFADTGQKINTLACLLAASTYDTAKIANVNYVLRNSGYKNIFVAKALLVLGDKDLIPIMKCIIANDFSEAAQYLTIDFLSVEKSLLEKFACDSLLSHDKRVQYLAIKAMGEIPHKLKNEQLLRQAVVAYDTLMKGWPIALLAQYKAPNILSLVKPLLEIEALREVSLRALTASDDPTDIAFVKQLISKKNFDRDLLNALINSDHEFYIASWLKMFEDNIFEDNYFFDIKKSKLAGNKKYFEKVTQLIFNKTNEQQLYSIMDFFQGMTDDETIIFLKKCLTHPIESVREKAGQFLAN